MKLRQTYAFEPETLHTRHFTVAGNQHSDGGYVKADGVQFSPPRGPSFISLADLRALVAECEKIESMNAIIKKAGK